MIKRTPQEIADFFGCYVFQSGEEIKSWLISRDKPTRREHAWAYTWNIDIIVIGEEFVSVPADHDWTKLYEPRPLDSDNKDSSYYQKTADSDNKHQSEVHVEKEYVLLGEFHPGTLMQKVDELLKDGFRLYGNPWTGPDSSCGYIHYQAMVRGV